MSLNAKGKSKYESPVIMPLGEMARGAGPASDCVDTGSSATAGYCRAGTTASPLDCTGGTTATSYCTDAGTAAGTACTAGVTATTEACTGGTFPGA